MTDYEFFKTISGCEKLYENFLLPVIICDCSLSAKWSNAAAKKLYPQLSETNAPRNLLGETDIPALLERMMSEGTLAVDGAFGLLPTRLNLMPVVSGDKLAGVALVVVEGGAVSTPENVLRLSETPFSLERSIRGNTAKIFDTLDSAVLKADLLDLRWMYPSLDKIAAGCYSIMRMAANISGYVQLAAGPRNLIMRTEDIFSLFMSSAPVLINLAESAGVELFVELPKADSTVSADTEKLSLAFFNLLHNAISFARPGGRVEVTGSVDKAKDAVVVLVTDNGPGVPEDIMPRIFEPYFTWPRTIAAEKHSRLGLGLTVSRLIAEAHQGSLGLTSPAGGGVAAELVIPRRTYGQKLKVTQETAEPAAQADRFSQVYVALTDL